MVNAQACTTANATVVRYDVSTINTLVDDDAGSQQETTLDMNNLEADYYKILLAEDIQLLTTPSKSSKPNTTCTDKIENDDTVSNSAIDLDEVLVNSDLLNSNSNVSFSDTFVEADVDDGENDTGNDDDDDVTDVSDLSDDKSTGILSYPLIPIDIFAMPEPVSSSRRISKQNVEQSASKKKLKSILSKKSLDTTSASTTTTTVNADDNKIFEFDFRVGFRDVTVRKYAFILGDNPACSNGPSLSISWEHHSEETYSVDDFEYRRDDLFTKDLIDLAMSAKTRLTIVRNLGYSADEIKTAIAEIHAIRAHRMATAKKNLVEKTGKVFSTVKLKLNQIIRNKKSEKGKCHTKFSVGNHAA
jgi:hypothetical protein